MSSSFVFWFLMLLSVLFGWWNWYGPRPPWGPFGNNLLLIILLGLLGWAVFGPPIRV